MSQNQPSVETFAIIPYAKWRSMEKRLKTLEQEEVQNVSHPQPSREASPEPKEMETEVDVGKSQPKKKDHKAKYQKVQMKKLLQHLERLDGSQAITSLDNIDQLIESALGSSKKMIPGEEIFFPFVFENNLSHFVKNRSKIALYYKQRDNWFQI